MLYRKLGNCKQEVSVLGFGCMRLPVVGGTGKAADIWDPNKPIDDPLATDMIQYAVDQGVNYFDTAFIYHGGKSEVVLGKAIKDCREKIMLATKLPAWMVKSPEDFDSFLNKQLARLDSSYLDFYLLHGLNRPLWQSMKEMGALEYLEKQLANGRIRYAGFSFHDDVKIFKEIVDGFDWTLAQIQYNYFDEHYQAGKEGLEYAASKGIGVVIMEPLRGGKLTDAIPEEVQKIWESAEKQRSPAEWALRWVWNHPEVSTALSGMSTMEQLEENIAIAEDASPNSLSDGEFALISQATEVYKNMLKIDCTGCAYCMPCPNGVNIPMNFSIYNDTFMFKDAEISYLLYNYMLAPEQRASNCQECGECQDHCPQQIDIMEKLKAVHEKLYRS
ncbi:MAG: aldo/keto reductase [Deltaproteobacteria bacterium]|nr:aldo/keto reductase [Deltaproteobacteria bacterium]